MSDSPPLPGVLAEIAAAAGEEAALAIADKLGGTEVYIPPEPGPDHWMVQTVGREAAQRIADRLTCGVGGLRVELPLGTGGRQTRSVAKASRKVDAMIEAGHSERDIALATGYTIRGVRKRKARRRDSRQLRLF
jgi:hypothetical protein